MKSNNVYHLNFTANFSGASRFIGITSPYLTWPDAQAYCRTHHTDLASSLNSSDNNFLLQLRDIQGDSWFGLYRDTWKWSDGTIASKLPWISGEPDNYLAIDNCASHINKVFNDYLCSQPAYFYCHTNKAETGGTWHDGEHHSDLEGAARWKRLQKEKQR
ncbi:C-type lectin lectoxin-Lio2-like [Tachysurus vachellii]|uniref:C-type lectin lectoxin-Lio2-like n=1 Tax=Tachysurus vachellii TaxID=175792 RepID=UPI00296AF5F6|nr:C-type lectin lectoxin-Lio2-like [Tachysurus vachellii]